MSDICKRLAANKKGRDFYVVDIRGCFDLLEKAMQELGFDVTKDRIFSVGDLVDRGSRSEDAIDWIKRPYFHAVRGNHEDMAIRAHTGNMDRENHIANGGAWIVGMTKEEQIEYSLAFQELPYMVEIEQGGDMLFGIVHAELMDGDWGITKEALIDKKHPRHKEAKQAVLWGRSKYNNLDDSLIKGIHILFVGHTPVDQVGRLRNVLYRYRRLFWWPINFRLNWRVKMNWVSKTLRQMARGQDCLINSPMCNHNAETTVLCHGRKGKGMALKACEGKYEENMKHSGTLAQREEKANKVELARKVFAELEITYNEGDNGKVWTFWLNGAKIVFFPSSHKWEHRASAWTALAKGVGLKSMFEYTNNLGDTKIMMEFKS